MKRLRSTLLTLSFLCCLHLPLYGSANFSLRVVSYNLENFWDGDPDNTDKTWEQYKKTLPRNERDKLKSSPQYDAYSKELSNWYKPQVLDSKINRFLEVIKLMKSPEIIALQEIESAGNDSKVFLTKDLSGRTLKSRLEALGYNYFIVGKQDPNNPVSVTTAFISKLPLEPLEPVVIGSKQPSTSSRDLQVVALNLTNERVLLINNHWKSKRGGNNEGTRIETAKTLRKRLANEQNNRLKTHVIVMGDLNTAYYEEPMRALGSTYSISRARKNPNLLYNLWYEKDESERWETSFSGVKGTLSHILISPSLLQESNLHYKKDSFKVFGHTAEENDLLMNVDGSPYRWQIRFYFDGFYHMGVGYSDHLPLLAEFTFDQNISLVTEEELSEEKFVFSNEDKLPGPSKLYFNDVKPCTEKEAINLLKVRNQNLQDLNKKCVLLEVDPSDPPLELQTRGRYHSSYVIVPSNSRYHDKFVLGLSMISPFNWRPNVYDSRISYHEANIVKGQYHDRNSHPRSNKCYQREVLQRKGGALRRALGRIGYNNGYLSIHILSREPSQIQLENLPDKKKQACPW